VDIILSEGYKGNPHPKIEVFRAVLESNLLCSQGDNLLAIASDQPLKAGVPCFDINDVKGLADLVEAKFLTRDQ
jgi:molybdopterin-guanine dinucleotide biosynthesis protein B